MSDHELPRRPSHGWRLRSTIRALMLMMVAFAVILAVLTPLFHFGLPPCLTPVKTAGWLVAKPAAASCVDCHGKR